LINLSNISLVCMSSVDLQGSIDALLKSSENIKFGEIILITHQKPDNLPSKIEYKFIDKINSIDEYSYNIIYKLENFFNKKYVLIIQSDGYVVNPESWKEEFLNYDYLGAPFRLPNDDYSYRDINKNLVRVGNGGFSLRSKKLVELPNKIGLEWKPFHGFYNEDGFICSMYRHLYIENGCTFAPLEIASLFSHEYDIPETNNIIPFGFHGKNSKWNNKKI